MSTLGSIPAERLLAAANDPRNAGSASDALRRAAGLQRHPRVALASLASQRLKRAVGKGKKRGERNATERRFEEDVLYPLALSGEIDRWEYETLTLRIPGVGAVTPDFTGWRYNELRLLFEVKAHVVHEASVLRMKAHAAARPWWRWQVWKRKDGSWVRHFDSQSHGP